MPARRIRVANTYPFDAAARQRLEGVSNRIDLQDVGPNTSDTILALTDRHAEVLLSDWPPADLGRWPRLRWLQSCHAGMNYLLGQPHRGPSRPHLGAAAPFWDRLTVTNASGVVNRSIAEYVMWALLYVNQQSSDRLASALERRWPQDAPSVVAMGGRPLRGQTALLVGYGSVGREVARLASAFGVRILAVKARPGDLVDERFHLPGTGDPGGTLPERVVGPERLIEVAAEADVLVSSLPLTVETRALIGAAVLAAMPRGATLVSVGRGAVIDEDALVAACRTGHLGVAVIDVAAREPLASDHPFWAEPRITVTPHVASASAQEWVYLADLVAENLRRYMAGERLLNVVDPRRGY